MTTRERADAIASSLSSIAGWPSTSADDLLEGLAAELGHPDVLDRFQTFGATRSHASPLSPVLHIFGPDTPASGVASLARSLLLGALNLVASPPSTLLTRFLDSLPPPLAAAVQHQHPLPEDWLRSAVLVVAAGDRPELSAIHGSLRPDQYFEPHPQSFGFAIVSGREDRNLAELAAAEVASALTLGETFLHDIYVAADTSTPEAFAGRLAESLDTLDLPPCSAPRGSVRDLRSGYTFRAASDQTASIRGADPPRPYTVIAETSPLFATAPAPGVVFVKPLPSDLNSAVRFVEPNIDTIAIHPFADESVAVALGVGTPRVRPFGNLTLHHLQRHPGGWPAYAARVRWTGLG